MAIELYNEDCLIGMSRIKDKSIDAIICDLPYGTTACKWDTIIPFEPLWEQYERIIKDNGVIVLTASQPFTSALIMSNPKMFKYEWIWDKEIGSNFQLANYQPLKRHENILVFSKAACVFTKKGYTSKYYPQKTNADLSKNRPATIGASGDIMRIRKGVYKRSDNYDETKRFPTTILNFNKNAAECNTTKRVHPTQKPVALIEYLIKTYTNEGDTVLDNCMGSGTTGVACRNLNRSFIGFEKEEKYFLIAKERIAKAGVRQLSLMA